MRSITLAALLTLLGGAAGAAGTVEVTFVEPDRFYDAGNSKREIPDNLKVIERHLHELAGKYLPDGQTLRISVLDVDLAGYTRPTPQGTDLRVARRGADWPRFTVRFALQAGGATVKEAEEVVADMNYGRHGQIQVYSSRDPLRYEKQMLDAWFRARFGTEP